jgi:hypothetical protein
MAFSGVPTVLTIRNIQVRIYTNDHPPPHVHAVKPGGGRARFELNCPDGPVRLLEVTKFRGVEIEEVGAAVAADLAAICGKWSRVHGKV